MGERSSFCFVFLLLFLGCGNTLNWQGTGALTTDNMTIIWSYINANFSKDWNSSTARNAADQNLPNFVNGFSDYLNSLWDPAWNVVVAFEYAAGKNTDSVLYGYGFRNHWMWYNGFLVNDNHYYGFIIWKDYNCITWTTYRSDVSKGNNLATAGTLNSIFNSLISTFDLNDIWGVALTATNQLEASLGGAFTVIASQSNSVFFTAKACIFGYFDRRPLTSNPQNGRMLVFQMR